MYGNPASGAPLFSSWMEDKRRLRQNHVNPLRPVAAAQTSVLVNLVLSRQTGFCKRLLGLGSKLYLSNILGVYSPFSYTKLTILILDECKFLKNGNKFVITVLIITTTTWKCLISRFIEDVNKRRRTFSLYEFAYIWENKRLVTIAKKYERMWIDRDFDRCRRRATLY